MLEKQHNLREDKTRTTLEGFGTGRFLNRTPVVQEMVPKMNKWDQ